MSPYKEFTGKNLDEAIREACAFFNVEREKLEIEIINDAKTGIFGLVGAKKATVRARKVSLDDIGLTFPSKEEKAKERGGKKPGRAKEAPREAKKQPPAGSLASRRAADPSFAPDGSAAAAPNDPPAAAPAAPKDARQEPVDTHPAIRPQNLPAIADGAAEVAADGGAEPRSRSAGRNRGKGRAEAAGSAGGTGETGSARPAQRDKKKNQPRSGKGDRQSPGGSDGIGGAGARRKAEAEAAPPFTEDGDGFEDQLPVIPLKELDQDRLRQTVLEALHNLVTPLADGTESSLVIDDGRVRVRLETEENQGLLIGRDGQTLAALQYLLTCITSRKLGASVRVQIDAGDYREKQEEKLRNLALALAQKVKNTQRPQSTRPLSAYHRRIIHLTLQDDPDVQTHSKSEGNLKSVVIVPRRKNSGK
ncbi:MAG: Jag N-terminal domain-containing protein [Deltaproteobacteria bacterium]|jgi:spoIIIJ-associated protein|nr:Jag N-terminal domain-containing protein [Deltaproteobacteria bacterium]